MDPTTSASGMSLESQRNAVVSAANLLMVALLKLNRVVVPALLRWMRARRQNWIRRASSDIARQLDRSTKRPRLCAGSCCGGSYNSILLSSLPNARNVHPDVMYAWLQAGGNATTESVAMMKQFLSSDAVEGGDDDGVGVEGEGEEGGDGKKAGLIGDSSDEDGDEEGKQLTAGTTGGGMSPTDDDGEEVEKRGGKTSAEQSVTAVQKNGASSSSASSSKSNKDKLKQLSGMSSDEVYFRLKVLEEERHRASTMIPIAYTTVMAVYVTLLSVIFYASVVIWIVLHSFSFETWEAVIFSFTLVSTAIISESETLMQVKKKAGLKSVFTSSSDEKQAKVVSATDAPTSSGDLVSVLSTMVAGKQQQQQQTGDDGDSADKKTNVTGLLPFQMNVGNMPTVFPQNRIIQDEDLSDDN